MFLTVSDLPDATRAGMSVADLELLVEDAESRALLAAPCLSLSLTETQRSQVVAVLRGAITRAAERSSRDDRQMTAGPFSIGPVSGATEPRALFWPSELDELRSICSRRGRAYVGWLG